MSSRRLERGEVGRKRQLLLSQHGSSRSAEAATMSPQIAGAEGVSE